MIKRKGHTVHREAQTFDRKQAANAWLSRRETGENANWITLATVIRFPPPNK